MITFEEVFSVEHLLACGLKCLRGTRWKSSAQMFELNLLQWACTLHRDLMDGKYRSKGFTNFTICERGKIRHISSVHISERCVQKCLATYVLKPLIIPRLIYDNAATIEDRGTEFAINRLREHLRHHLARHGHEGGILTLDYHNYFGSISHDRLLDKLKPLVEDERIFNLIKYFIDCFPEDYGLGLGSEVSQMCAVFYPNEIDHYFKDKLQIHGYARYMDDSYIISDSLEELRRYRQVFIEQSRAHGLEINEKMTQITPFHKGSFVYLKKRIFITPENKIVMRLASKNITQRRRGIKKQHKLLCNGAITSEAMKHSFVSWQGFASKYNSHTSVQHLEELLESCLLQQNL